MTQHSVALLYVVLLTAWLNGPDAVVVPYNHPASPDARPAPPITVPRIQAPNLEVTPEPAREPAGARQQPQPSPTSGAPTHQHQH